MEIRSLFPSGSAIFLSLVCFSPFLVPSLLSSTRNFPTSSFGHLRSPLAVRAHAVSYPKSSMVRRWIEAPTLFTAHEALNPSHQNLLYQDRPEDSVMQHFHGHTLPMAAMTQAFSRPTCLLGEIRGLDLNGEKRSLRSKTSGRFVSFNCPLRLSSISTVCAVPGHTLRAESLTRAVKLFVRSEAIAARGKSYFSARCPQKNRRTVVVAGSGLDMPFTGKEIPANDGSVLTGDGSEMRNTLRLVECAMLAATAGLAYFLSNLFRLEAYFGCFFPLPVVISSMRWGAAAGRKTMLGTAMLLLVLSGPLKAASYLLMHGFVGLGMGSLWRWRSNWLLSIAVCTVVRSLGAMGFVLLSSWLLRENLLALITINAHASFSYILAAIGINIVPSMLAIYFVFAGLLLINCGSFVFLLHVLYAIFLKRLGIPLAIAVPGWIERAI